MKEILLYNYWEHHKLAKELALVLPINHPRRLEVEKSLNEIQKQLEHINQNT